MEWQNIWACLVFEAVLFSPFIFMIVGEIVWEAIDKLKNR